MHHNINYTKNIDHRISFMKLKENNQNKLEVRHHIYMEKVKAIEMKILEEKEISLKKERERNQRENARKGKEECNRSSEIYFGREENPNNRNEKEFVRKKK
jgi:hypothetical protein